MFLVARSGEPPPPIPILCVPDGSTVMLQQLPGRGSLRDQRVVPTPSVEVVLGAVRPRPSPSFSVFRCAEPNLRHDCAIGRRAWVVCVCVCQAKNTTDEDRDAPEEKT